MSDETEAEPSAVTASEVEAFVPASDEPLTMNEVDVSHALSAAPASEPTASGLGINLEPTSAATSELTADGNQPAGQTSPAAHEAQNAAPITIPRFVNIASKKVRRRCRSFRVAAHLPPLSLVAVRFISLLITRTRPWQMEQSKICKLSVVSVNGAIGAQVTCGTTILSMGDAGSARSLTQKAQRKVRAAIALGMGQKKTRQKNSIIFDIGAKGSTSRLPARLQTRLSSKKIAPVSSRRTEPTKAQVDPTAGIPPTHIIDAGDTVICVAVSSDCCFFAAVRLLAHTSLTSVLAHTSLTSLSPAARPRVTHTAPVVRTGLA